MSIALACCMVSVVQGEMAGEAYDDTEEVMAEPGREEGGEGKQICATKSTGAAVPSSLTCVHCLDGLAPSHTLTVPSSPHTIRWPGKEATE